MNKQQANRWLQEFNSQYLVIGYKPDGFRGVPPTFETVLIPADSPEDVFNSMKGLSEVKVFEIMQSQYDESWWKSMAVDQANRMTEMEERELLQKLKVKYESQ